MAPKKVAIPSTPDGMQELLNNAAQLKEVFRDEDSIKEFAHSYGRNFSKANSESMDDLREQVQSMVAEMVRNNGGRSRLNIGALTDRDGLPKYAGSAALAKGKGGVWNKYSRGAALEKKFPDIEDRFGSINEMLQAIREEAKPSGSAARTSLLHKMACLREFQNSFGSEDPGAGGFLIPEIMRSELLSVALEESIVRSRATVIPMSTLSVPMPAIDDTSHVSSVYGGIQFYWTEEAASLTESQATFAQIILTAKKLAGYFTVPNQLLADAPAFSAFFDTLVPGALAYFEDIGFMTGTSVGEPQGFIGCDASASVAAQSGQATKTIVWENIVGMYARMLPTSLANAVWIASIDTFPQLATMALSVGTGGGPVWIGGYGNSGGASTPPMTILGRPVVFTEKASALGTAGDINFVDLKYYLVGDRQAIEVASSEHVAFQNDKTAFRIIERVDGRPWIQSAITPQNGSTNTLTPFVQLASR